MKSAPKGTCILFFLMKLNLSINQICRQFSGIVTVSGCKIMLFHSNEQKNT